MNRATFAVARFFLLLKSSVDDKRCAKLPADLLIGWRALFFLGGRLNLFLLRSFVQSLWVSRAVYIL